MAEMNKENIRTVVVLDDDKIMETLGDIVQTHKNGTRVNWKEVAQEMNKSGSYGVRSNEAWRSFYNSRANKNVKPSKGRSNKKRYDEAIGSLSDVERLITRLKTGKRTLAWLCEMLGWEEGFTLEVISRANLYGYNLKVWIEKSVTGVSTAYVRNLKVMQVGEPEEVQAPPSVGKTLKIAIVSDTHIGSIYEATDKLTEFYEYAHKKGVRTFYHAGDITDGYYTGRSGSIFEQNAVGFQQQLNAVVDRYPTMKGVKTFFITGNHDATHMNNGGANVGEVISRYRDDLIYLGHNFGKIWLTEKVDLSLIHPGDGSSYSVTQKIQKIIDTATGKRKSKIMVAGHYHKSGMIFYKDTYGFVLPSFQYQSEFMKTRNLESYIGGYILTLNLDDEGDLISLTTELVEFKEE